MSAAVCLSGALRGSPLLRVFRGLVGSVFYFGVLYLYTEVAVGFFVFRVILFFSSFPCCIKTSLAFSVVVLCSLFLFCFLIVDPNECVNG